MPETIPLKLTGRELTPALPALLNPAKRSAGEPPDEFLPPGYLTPVASFDVSAATRGTADGAGELVLDAPADEVLVIELADGGTLITSAAKLKASLERTRPDLIVNGEIQFEKLRAEGATAHRGFGEAVGGLVSKVFAVVVGGGGRDDAIIDAARDRIQSKQGDVAELGITWAGTKALMWVIEDQLYRKTKREPGLYRWVGAAGDKRDFEDPKQEDLDEAVKQAQPMLVFVHGTASSTLGSFGDLHTGDRAVWSALERHYTGGIFALEHRTLSESPIENALQLAAALPDRAHISLVSHSRGGLVADLMCLQNFDALIERFHADVPGTGESDEAEAARVLAARDTAHAEHREQLRDLAQLLRTKQFVVQRYVRVASPANGTRLASGNFDVFLSGLLTLIGAVPFFFGSPLYSAFKRVVLEIAKNRTNPHMVPGIEAMLPDSPMARLLRDAPVREGIEMAVVAGDIEGGGLLQRLGVLLTDFLLFDNVDNDLVVDTAAMLTGIAPEAKARALFDRGTDVSHFRYFTNVDTRAALRDWLTSDKVLAINAFQTLPGRFEDMDALEEQKRLDDIGKKRGTDKVDLPVVVVLPGVMGSHLWVGGKDRVWFDPLDIADGGLAKIAWSQAGVDAEKLFSMLYGGLCEHLAENHRVETFAYDWRQPLDVLGERLGGFLEGLLKDTKQPIRLLAHSMGGLVVRACIHRRGTLMSELMGRDGARFVMLGTPNQGAHSMVENLLGKGSTLRSLATLDVKHKMQAVLNIVADFPGPLQLLPKPGFKDTFQGQDDGGMDGLEYQKAQTWIDFTGKVRDRWFGDETFAKPAQKVLDAANWLWAQDGKDKPALPEGYEKKTSYVFGVGRNTPCGVREEKGRLRMVGTTRGDGTVTWDSGRIDRIGSFYYMPAQHGDLPDTKEYFPALTDLLLNGATNRLATSPPAVRAIEQAQPVVYDAGPPTLDGGDAVARGLMGGSARSRVVARPQKRLEVSVKAMDLRFLRRPVMVGHYQQDPIAGPQSLIDRELLDGDLSERYNLGLYAGPRGTAIVVLRAPNEQERQRGSLAGAVVTGLGAYDGALSVTDLTEAVRTGVLRYLLQVIDVLGKDDRNVPLAALLLGYNSSANLTVAASVEALVRGVIEANQRFAETTRLKIRVDRLDIVELYQDTAITAVYELRKLPEKLDTLTKRYGTLLVCRPDLEYGDGWRPRLFDCANQSYWPRLIVTDADRREGECPPPSYDNPAPDPGADASREPGSGAPQSPERRRTALANRLRFLYVGQRARAESVVQQRQPGLIETLVRQQIHTAVWQEDFGRMLFQLMVPHDFKDAARQLERVVLVVDAYTANLPWELMLADSQGSEEDKRPLSVRTPVVRQLSSTTFRRHVRQSPERTALVIGNPSVEGFSAAFPDPRHPQAAVPTLPAAEEEAKAIAAVLGGMGYGVVQAIGEDRKASDVLALLYRQPYRIVHISAHGVFDLPHADGLRRSGVVLSDGLLITAAEIDAMEMVPELVFLSCCHLGKVDTPDSGRDERTVRDGNKLAASVARELIEIGVRCVVVAGWAVDDQQAKLFGETFYQQLMLQRQPFGEAVHAAREALWKSKPEDITWGAYQAYGDPGWRAEPRGAGNGGGGGSAEFASPEELLDALAKARADMSRKTERLSDREMRAQAQAIEELIKKRCPPGWLTLPMMQSALGATWSALGRHEKARAAYLNAVQAEDRAGRVPIRDIEQLADLEARLGEKAGDDQMIDRAVNRLKQLDLLVSNEVKGEPGSAIVNAERCALRGGAFKRKASMYARGLLAAYRDSTDNAKALQAKEKMASEHSKMQQALVDAREAYRQGEGVAGDARFKPYNALNRLALDALTPWPEKEDERDAAVAAAVAFARQCRQAAAQDFGRSRTFWDAIMQPEALLVERLLDGSLGQLGDAGKVALNEVLQAYREALSNLTATPTELDSMVSQMNLMATFCDALYVAGGDEAWQRVADALLELVQRLQPGIRPPDHRPLPGKPVAPTTETPAVPIAPAEQSKTAMDAGAPKS